MRNPSGGGSAADPKSATASLENGIDASVGGLVWVRRRNGSWWPGRIVGLDEVSDGCLVSPRSGTPVRLLGRDDASVDWYNLEKSKRVKAFRCGEFDECIAKAKAAADNAGKKAVKYARREDAVIHALELESARLGRDHPDYFSRTDNSGNADKKSPTKSHSIQECEDLCNNESVSDSAPGLSQSGITFEESNHINVSKVQSRRRTPNDSEDDGTKKTKRMRGLEDLGVVVGSKRKAQAGAVLEPVQPDSTTAPCDSNTGNAVSNGVPLNGDKSCTLSFKRKRSQVANVHEFLKKKNRHRQLTKVLENTPMVPVPDFCDQLASSNGSPRQSISDSKVSGIESNESGKSLSVVVDNNSDSNGFSYENGAVLQASEHVCDAPNGNQKMKENEIISIPELPEKDSSDILFDVLFTGEQKRYADVSPILDSSLPGRHQTVVLGKQSSEDDSQVEAPSLKNEPISVSSAGVEIEKNASKWQSKGKRKSRHKCKNRKQDSSLYAGIDASNAGIGAFIGQRESHMRDLTVEMKPQRSLPYRQSRYTVNSRYHLPEFQSGDFCADSRLYDVRLGVKVSYRPQDVPLVSLMSKSNGKAIVGHPLTIEVVGNGFCNQSMNTMEPDMSVPFNAGKRRTLKRNSEAERVPRRATSKQSYSRRRSAKLKKSGILSKKTRKLSSLTGQRQNNAERKPFADKSTSPVIACVPLKLVFSRINEAVSGSAWPTHRALPSG